ncbi:MAG TPA: TetR/AcrR family transcriptional regulator [Galbitalea sp.]|jgi:AcrR family transcriptional regulator|nr:TetR/AcrR family transcriptional regulator [Galbitalea sp.]
MSSRRGSDRREELIAVATRLIARNGSRGTTLADIAHEAGVSQAAVVYHFGTKEGLVNAILDARDSFEDGLIWRDGPDPGMRIFGIISEIVASWADHPDLVGLLGVLIAENVGDDDALRPRLAANYRLTVDRLATTLRSSQKRGEMRGDVDPQAKAIEILAYLSGLELAWLVSSDIPAAATTSAWAAEQIANLGSDAGSSGTTAGPGNSVPKG